MTDTVLVATEPVAALVVTAPSGPLVLEAQLPVAVLVAAAEQGPAGPPGGLDQDVQTQNFTAEPGSSYVLRGSGLVINLPPSPGEGAFEIVGVNGDEGLNPHVIHAAAGEAIYAAGQSAQIATLSSTGLKFEFVARPGGWDVFLG